MDAREGRGKKQTEQLSPALVRPNQDERQPAAGDGTRARARSWEESGGLAGPLDCGPLLAA